MAIIGIGAGYALLALLIVFIVVYLAVRMAVSDAIRNTIRSDLLSPEPRRTALQLPAGDDE